MSFTRFVGQNIRLRAQVKKKRISDHKNMYRDKTCTQPTENSKPTVGPHNQLTGLSSNSFWCKEKLKTVQNERSNRPSAAHDVSASQIKPQFALSTEQMAAPGCAHMSSPSGPPTERSAMQKNTCEQHAHHPEHVCAMTRYARAQP